MPRRRDVLAEGCAALHLRIDDDQLDALLTYVDLLVRWNRVFNLTAVRDPDTMIRRHLLDSLTILPWVTTGPVLDVGTGAGLPGLPLAIAKPGLSFTLLDTNGKKTRFVQQAVAELGLSNVEVVKDRVETLRRPGGFARVLTRAFATLADIVDMSNATLAPDGQWLAMKGAAPHAEIRDLPPGIAARIEPLRVPGEPGSRHLVVLTREPDSELA